MLELREDTFYENKNTDLYDHVDRVLNIVSLFNIPRVSQDAILLRAFPFTLTGSAKIWVDRLTPGAVNTWDLLKKAFIQSTMNRQLLDSHGPIPGMTPTQALTAIQTMADNSQKWHDGTSSRNVSSNSNTDRLAAIVSKLDNLGRNIKKLKENVHAIQVGCQIFEGPHLDKECPLNEEVKQVEEVNYGEFGHPAPLNGSKGAKFRVGPPGYYTRTDNQTPSGEKKPNLVETINKYMEGAAKTQAEQDEWLKTFSQNTKKSRIDHDKIIQKLESHVKTLTAEVETKVAKLEEFKTIFANDRTPLYTSFYYSPEELEYFSPNFGFLDDEKSESTELKTSKLVKIDKFILLVDFVMLDMIEDLRMPVILGRPLLATAHTKVEIFRKTISLEVGNEKVQESYEEIVYRCSLITQEANGGFNPFKEKCDGGSLCHNEIKCYWESKNDGKRIYVEWENLSLNDWLRIRFGEVSEIARDKILRDHWRKRFGNEYDDSEDFKDPGGCEENKENEILKTIINKLHDECFKGTNEDDDNLEGIIDYLEPTLYDGFIDSDDEEYKERKCILLGMPYIKPPPILIEKTKVTRYSVGLGEVYTKIKFSKMGELSRTRGNIANIRAGIMEEILRNDDEKESYDET
ncbi:hypothetical protein Tco_1228786 [Tanacetum coccineum]